MKDALPENIRWNSNRTSLSWHSNKVRSPLVWSHIVRDSRTCLKLFTFQSCSVSIYPCKRITKTLKSKSQYYIWGVDLLIVLIWNQSDCELPSEGIHISEPQFCSHKRPDLHSTPILATFLLIHTPHAHPHVHPHAHFMLNCSSISTFTCSSTPAGVGALCTLDKLYWRESRIEGWQPKHTNSQNFHPRKYLVCQIRWQFSL